VRLNLQRVTVASKSVSPAPSHRLSAEWVVPASEAVTVVVGRFSRGRVLAEVPLPTAAGGGRHARPDVPHLEWGVADGVYREAASRVTSEAELPGTSTLVEHVDKFSIAHECVAAAMLRQQVLSEAGQEYGLILSDLPEVRTMLRHLSSSLTVNLADAN
jgi:hypothetical protein